MLKKIVANTELCIFIKVLAASVYNAAPFLDTHESLNYNQGATRENNCLRP